MGHLVLKGRDILRNNTRRMVQIRDSSRKRNLAFLRLGILLCASANFFSRFQAFELRHFNKKFFPNTAMAKCVV